MYYDWDGMMENLIRKHIKNDWVCCDVGSCEGRFTNVFINLANTGKVYAFDINDNNPLIKGAINERIAVSDIDGYEKTYDCGSHMSNILGYDVGKNTSDFVKEIISVKLDTYFENIQVDCLKIDVEGAELKVIKGGLNTINKCKLVLIECHMDEDWEAIYDLLNKNFDTKFYELSTNQEITRDYTIGPRKERPYQIYKIKQN